MVGTASHLGTKLILSHLVDAAIQLPLVSSLQIQAYIGILMGREVLTCTLSATQQLYVSQKKETEREVQLSASSAYRESVRRCSVEPNMRGIRTNCPK